MKRTRDAIEARITFLENKKRAVKKLLDTERKALSALMRAEALAHSVRVPARAFEKLVNAAKLKWKQVDYDVEDFLSLHLCHDSDCYYKEAGYGRYPPYLYSFTPLQGPALTFCDVCLNNINYEVDDDKVVTVQIDPAECHPDAAEFLRHVANGTLKGDALEDYTFAKI